MESWVSKDKKLTFEIQNRKKNFWYWLYECDDYMLY
jgi:hypothetical protein